MAADPRLIQFARQMRREPTPAEEAIWKLLRNRRLSGHRFRRQHPIGLYIADFYCAESALVVEVDGDSHTSPAAIEYDKTRNDYMEGLGLFVLRFWNFDVKESKDELLELVAQLCQERQGTRRSPVPKLHRRPRGKNNG